MSIFICGTDTDIGKTITSGLLMRELSQLALNKSVRYWKPVQSGAEDDDSQVVQDLSGVLSDQILSKLWHFTEPVSPHLAAEIDGQKIELKNITEAYKRYASQNSLIVEGAGGLLVPLSREPQITWLDFLAETRLPVLLVARSGLGTINHSLLTLRCLQERDLPVVGIVFCGPENLDNKRTVCEFAQVPCVGAFDYQNSKADFWQPFNIDTIKSFF